MVSFLAGKYSQLQRFFGSLISRYYNLEFRREPVITSDISLEFTLIY